MSEGLDDARMQAIAREFNLSETVFVLAGRQPGSQRQPPHLHAGPRTALRRTSDGRYRLAPGDAPGRGGLRQP